MFQDSVTLCTLVIIIKENEQKVEKSPLMLFFEALYLFGLHE
jgi:hypothetical protein